MITVSTLLDLHHFVPVFFVPVFATEARPLMLPADGETLRPSVRRCHAPPDNKVATRLRASENPLGSSEHSGRPVTRQHRLDMVGTGCRPRFSFSHQTFRRCRLRTGSQVDCRRVEGASVIRPVNRVGQIFWDAHPPLRAWRIREQSNGNVTSERIEFVGSLKRQPVHQAVARWPSSRPRVRDPRHLRRGLTSD
jgi:hypothetical protein